MLVRENMTALVALVLKATMVHGLNILNTTIHRIHRKEFVLCAVLQQEWTRSNLRGYLRKTQTVVGRRMGGKLRITQRIQTLTVHAQPRIVIPILRKGSHPMRSNTKLHSLFFCCYIPCTIPTERETCDGNARAIYERLAYQPVNTLFIFV